MATMDKFFPSLTCENSDDVPPSSEIHTALKDMANIGEVLKKLAGNRQSKPMREVLGQVEDKQGDVHFALARLPLQALRPAFRAMANGQEMVSRMAGAQQKQAWETMITVHENANQFRNDPVLKYLKNFTEERPLRPSHAPTSEEAERARQAVLSLVQWAIMYGFVENARVNDEQSREWDWLLDHGEKLWEHKWS